VRPISDLSTLYYEFSEYRLEMLVDRVESQLKKLRVDHRAGKKTDVKKLKGFLTEQEEFLKHMNKEMFGHGEVEKGVLPIEDMPEDRPETVTLEDSPKRARLQ
jgi:hypothetical protein